MKERQRLAVEYGIDVAAARGGWLAEEEALQVRRLWPTHTYTTTCTQVHNQPPPLIRRSLQQVLQEEVMHLGTWLTRQTNIAPGSPQQAFIGAMAACVDDH